MTLDKFKTIIGYNNPKVIYFIIGVVSMSALDSLAQGNYTTAALYGVLALINILLDRTDNGQKAQ